MATDYDDSNTGKVNKGTRTIEGAQQMVTFFPPYPRESSESELLVLSTSLLYGHEHFLIL